MAENQHNGNDECAPDGVLGEMTLTDIMYVELGRTSGPPQPRAVANVPKQWQPPKNESTPNNRARPT